MHGVGLASAGELLKMRAFAKVRQPCKSSRALSNGSWACTYLTDSLFCFVFFVSAFAGFAFFRSFVYLLGSLPVRHTQRRVHV